jgi:hypothetical protein
MLHQTVNENIDGLIILLGKLDDHSYQQTIASLSNATIGQHTRHIIEMYLCLIEGYENGIVNYDNRRRDKNIETDRNTAIAQLISIKGKTDVADKSIVLENIFNNNVTISKSSYQRELLYNLEHSIHHQALIKVGLMEINRNITDENFGVAQSTIEYRKKCVQ